MIARIDSEAGRRIHPPSFRDFFLPKEDEKWQAKAENLTVNAHDYRNFLS